MGSVTGAFLAALLIAELNAFGILILPEITLVAAFAAMAVVLVIRPYGLLGRPATSQPHAVEIQPPQTLGRPGRVAAAALVAIMLVLPLIADSFVVVLAGDIMIFALFAAGLHFMMGTGGLISFGHAAFFGLGAYAAALLTRDTGLGMEIVLILAPFFAAAGAAVVGWFAIRLSGVYLAMLTLLSLIHI